MKLHEFLTESRKERHMTIADVAARADLPLSTLLKVFAGTVSDPNYSTVVRIADALGLTADDLAQLFISESRARCSRQALSLARSYDSLDEHGQHLVDIVVREEEKRMHREAQQADAGRI